VLNGPAKMKGALLVNEKDNSAGIILMLHGENY